MRVILLGRKLYSFELPEKVDGSYWMPYGDDSSENLINIEARNDQWVMKTNDETAILRNNGILPEVVLENDCFYNLLRNNQQLIIYTTKTYDESFKTYQFNNDCNIRIGNAEGCEILYNVMYMNGVAAVLTFQQGIWYFTLNNNIMCFKNDLYVEQKKIPLKSGDIIFLYGLKIVVVKNYLMINNPGNLVTLNPNIFIEISKTALSTSEELPEVKEKNLYEDNDYYLKSPRISRIIDKKEITIASPPESQLQQEQPFIFVMGPMLATATVSLVTLSDLLGKINSGETTMQKSWPQLVTAIIMIISTLLWPALSTRFRRKQFANKEGKRISRYNAYLEKKRSEIDIELKNEQMILNDAFPPYTAAVNIILQKNRKLWERKNEQKDFLQVKLGKGDIKSFIDLKYQVEDFTLNEDTLKENLESVVESSKTLIDVPVTYSFLQNRIVAIMGNATNKSYLFTKSILIQLMAYHSYDELKFVVLTNNKKLDFWNDLKLAPHCFNNDKTIRYFASNREERTEINKILLEEVRNRKNELEDEKNQTAQKVWAPHYLILTDDVQNAVKLDFFNDILNEEASLGFSVIVLENQISQLPSKCTDFISLGPTSSDVFEMDAESNSHQIFRDELTTDFDLGVCSQILSNIPIKFNTSNRYLPNSLSFLEMLNVGKVEQLNILSRWKQNNPIKSLKAQIGVDDIQEPIYLDLHEKAHGPHGLIAGMTGSGKSEFIISYILAMAINYSPEEVSFILIDYKGGGLVGAFENQKTGAVLPHLAGKITNLDKAEMKRTLVSIDSELRRRQQVFNDARDSLGESTIDIYKYQRLFREGKLTEPVSHLFIICDEFAELKSQQPEFMDNLISTARIGRSLGVHLILATQKPSGVVNDQIWSNTRFRVCLKVQDKSDSNEMIKVPDAAEIKQTGRFYLQVGYNEIFMLGQSGWTGAPYYPTELIKKDYDRSVSFINNVGEVIQSNENTTSKKKVVAMGDELTATVKYIIDTAKKENIVARKMWLDKIPPVIFVNNLLKKYDVKPDKTDIKAIVGELDDPSNQKQELLTLSLTETGNTAIYSISGSDREQALKSIIYSTMCIYNSQDINWYIVDFGAESLRIFSKIPHIGDMVFNGEKEKLTNLFKLLDETIEERKKILVDYQGSYLQYVKTSGKSLPLIGVVFNDFDAIDESDNTLQDTIAQYARDCERYGIFIILTCSGWTSMRGKLRQCFDNVLVLQMNSKDDYTTIVGPWQNVCLFDYPGRGLVKKENIYEFQTATLFPEETFQEYMDKFVESVRAVNTVKAKRIPILPDRIPISMFADDIKGLDSLVVGLSKATLEPSILDISDMNGYILASNEIQTTNNILKVLLKELVGINKTKTICIDAGKVYETFKESFDNYIPEGFDTLDQTVTQLIDQNKASGFITLVVVAEPGKLKTKAPEKILNAMSTEIKKRDEAKAIFTLSTNSSGLEFDTWYTSLASKQNGLWIGPGFVDQDKLRVSSLDKSMRQPITEEFGWKVKNSNPVLIKLIDAEAGDENE